MKEFFTRLAFKLTGLKAMFGAAVLAILVVHDLSPENADVMSVLIVTVLGAKAVQYGADVLKVMKGKGDDESEV